MYALALLLVLQGDITLRLEWDEPVISITQPAPTLKEAVQAYMAGGGQVAYVQGKSNRSHLIEDHGWSAAQLNGLTQQELMYLHGATHSGKISPSDYPVIQTEAEPVIHVDDKPLVWGYYPSWQCDYCDRAKAHDWSKYPFRIKWVLNDDEALRAYPAFHMKATKPNQKPAYYYGFNPGGLLAEWNKRN